MVVAASPFSSFQVVPIIGAMIKHTLRSACLIAAIALAPHTATAQGTPQTPSPLTQAAQLDRDGKTAEARALMKSLIDSPAVADSVKRQALRSIVMSYAFDADCRHALEYEEKLIDYWRTREKAEPQNAFFQQGELANEGARICIDAGDLEAAEKWYRKGYELGMKEPAPRTHAAALWDFRRAHALARIAARRGDKAEAQRQIVSARAALDSDTAVARQQERFFPYLTGYVALYTNDLPTAEKDLTRAVSLPGNERDPFMTYLLALTYDKLGRSAEAKSQYQKAYDLANAHNPPSAFVRRNVSAQLKR